MTVWLVAQGVLLALAIVVFGLPLLRWVLRQFMLSVAWVLIRREEHQDRRRVERWAGED